MAEKRILPRLASLLSKHPSVLGSRTHTNKRRRRELTTASTVVENEDYVAPTDSSNISHPLEPSRERREALQSAKPFSAFLTDTFNRQHDYLRISITERCNLRCLYCMPAEGVSLSPKKHILTPQEIQYISALFVAQGVTKIRLTGGEPTVHPQILGIVKEIGSLRSRGLRELALTTNGLNLSRKLDAMIDAGVTGINLSLDTLDPFQFEIMTRRRGFDQVMKSVQSILERNRVGANIRLKINVVMIRGLNEAQLLPFVELTREKDLEVRFIEYMPFDGNRWSSQKMYTYKEMLNTIRSQHPTLEKVQDHLNDTSKTYKIPGHIGRIGFITSMTEHFCGTCNRLRITSDGNLKVCLFGNAEVSLRDLLRDNLNNGEPIDQEAWEAMRQVEMDRAQGLVENDQSMREKEMQLLDVIGMAVKRKKAKHAGIGQLEHMKNRPMILIDSPGGDFDKSKESRTSSRTQHQPWTRMPVHMLPPPNFPSISSRSFSSSHAPLSTKPTASSPAQPTLTHLTSSGAAHMVHIPPPTLQLSSSTTDTSKSQETKPATSRLAIARALIRFSNPAAIQLIRDASLKKGDVIATARLAGIMAAKRTSELIPLCHNIVLSGVNVDVDLLDAPNDSKNHAQSQNVEDGNETLQNEDPGSNGAVAVTASVRTFGQTGVEMEALVAASMAALTVYDMCKAVDKGMRMESVRVVLKEGGRSGTWKEGRQFQEQ